MSPFALVRRSPRRGTPARRLSSASTAALLAVAVLGSACASSGDTREVEPPPPPKSISRLPASIASFDFDGYRRFEDGGEGYTFRYSNPPKKRLADVYVYPVAAENANLEHEALVLGSTRATIQAIGEAVNQGVYANFAVLDAATRATGVRTTARVQATYLRENLASYTLLYQTEHEGTLMKIRVSMPDNESNRANGEWDAFATRVFDLLIEGTEPAPSLEAALPAGAERVALERRPGR